MSKSEIQITISSQTGKGKSRVLYLLKKLLKEEGFEIEFDGGIDFENEESFDREMMFDLTTSLHNIKDISKIIFKEVQTKL